MVSPLGSVTTTVVASLGILGALFGGDPAEPGLPMTTVGDGEASMDSRSSLPTLDEQPLPLEAAPQPAPVKEVLRHVPQQNKVTMEEEQVKERAVAPAPPAVVELEELAPSTPAADVASGEQGEDTEDPATRFAAPPRAPEPPPASAETCTAANARGVEEGSRWKRAKRFLEAKVGKMSYVVGFAMLLDAAVVVAAVLWGLRRAAQERKKVEEGAAARGGPEEEGEHAEKEAMLCGELTGTGAEGAEESELEEEEAAAAVLMDAVAITPTPTRSPRRLREQGKGVVAAAE